MMQASNVTVRGSARAKLASYVPFRSRLKVAPFAARGAGAV